RVASAGRVGIGDGGAARPCAAVAAALAAPAELLLTMGDGPHEAALVLRQRPAAAGRIGLQPVFLAGVAEELAIAETGREALALRRRADLAQLLLVGS